MVFNWKILGAVFVLIGISVLFYVLYQNSNVSKRTEVFSPYSILTASWEIYKQEFINSDGRVIDYSKNAITTSEGQSYAMLRSIWMDDKKTFDLAWKWTQENLRRPNDHLFGWIWGKREDGTFGLLKDGDNSASDADSDIALALLFAAKRWGDSKYRDQARLILADLWDKSTDIVAGKRYLAAGNWARSQDYVVINPSYFAPYAWRIFQKEDPTHAWEDLLDPAYALLSLASDTPFDKGRSVGLPPDWIVIDRKAGEIKSPPLPELKVNYSYDAARVPFRIALDYEWNKDEKAYQYLKKSFQFLKDEYQSKGKLFSSYTHDGNPIVQVENPVMYAGALGYFVTVEPDLAKKVYTDKIIRLYTNDQNNFRSDLPYYEQNWLWFGTAFYYHRLIPYT